MTTATINTDRLVTEIHKELNDGFTETWLTNYNGGISLNPYNVWDDPKDLQAVKVGETNRDFENVLVDLNELLDAINITAPLTKLVIGELITIDNVHTIEYGIDYMS